MPDVRTIPMVNIEPDQELSAEQIVQVANGELQVFNDGERVGIILPRKHRALFITAIAVGYLKYSKRQTRLAEAFFCWCDAKAIPCVAFAIENDCVDVASTNDSMEKDDPLVTMHFDVATAGRPFTKSGLVAVTEFLLGNLWDLALSPWKITAGVLPFSLARQLVAHVHKIWDTTSEPAAQSGVLIDPQSKPSGPQMIH
jgi:hypothetical protein